MRLSPVRTLAVAVVVGSTLLLSGCGGTAEAESTPDVLKMGVPPGEADPKFLEQFQPMADAVEKGSGIPVKVTKTSDYLAIVEAMRSRLIDVAAFSPFPTVLAKKVAGVEPLVVAEGAPYSSLIVCRPDAKVTELSQVADHPFAFVDAGSTSGNYIPRLMLKQAGVDLEAMESTFAGGHDVAALAVKQGSADCAAVASMVWKQMLDSGTISDKDALVVAESDPIPISMVIIARKGLSEEAKQGIIDEFVTSQDPGSLKVTGATKFVAGKDADFSVFEDAARELGVDLEEVE